jgi:hypothetical protein
MSKDAVSWLCVVGDRGISWIYLVLDPDHILPDKLPGKIGKLDPYPVDRQEFMNCRYGHQN